MTPRQRIERVCGTKAGPVLHMYDQFLGWMADPGFREVADKATIDRKTHDETFRHAKSVGQDFSDALYSLFREQYPPEHPIHKTLIL